MQVMSSLIIATVFLGAHVKCQPFEDDMDDNVQSASHLSCCLTLWAAALLMGKNETDGGVEGPDSNLVGIFMIVVNLTIQFILRPGCKMGVKVRVGPGC